MKFACTCESVITDQTDYLPYAGYLISDQDIQDIYEMSDCGDLRHLLTRKMYQCRSCGRLWIEDQNRKQLKAFIPEEPSPHFLSSIYGQNWKRVLRGTWTDEPVLSSLPRGFLSWTHLSDEERATFDEWDLLEEAYHSRFEDLKRQGILRDALLKKNGDTIHNWRWSTKMKAKGEPGASPNGGLAAPVDNSNVTEGPPSVS